jgi:two-component system chemotaxis response regulator CheB
MSALPGLAYGTPIRVLVAEGSPSVRDALVRGLTGEALEVVATAANGHEAVQKTRALRPDVVLLEDQLPLLDGIGAARQIMASSPSRVLLITGATDEAQVKLAVEAMAAGALELVPRPPPGTGDQGPWIKRLAQTVRLMWEVPVIGRRKTPAGGWSLTPPAAEIGVVGLVASTGGPNALATILSGLPGDFAVPVVAVQHMPPGFMPGLVRWLSLVCPLLVQEAVHGEPCLPGRVYCAPDSMDLRVVGDCRFQLTPAANGFFSSGNALLQSLAETYGARAAGVVLTGMGDDGSAGLLGIRRAGGVTMAQSAATCAVFGMPGAAAQCGATKELLAPEEIRRRIVQLAGHEVDPGSRGGTNG